MADGIGAPYQDPGWRPALGAYIGRAKGADGIAILRALFLALLAAPFLILYLLTVIMDDLGSPTGFLLPAVVAGGTAVVFSVRKISRSGLDPSSAERSVANYRSRFFLAFAINEMPLLLSFVLCFIEDELWPYLVELPIFLVGMAVIAPGKRNLDKLDNDLMQRGAHFSLRAEFAAALPPRG